MPIPIATQAREEAVPIFTEPLLGDDPDHFTNKGTEAQNE